MNNPYDDKYLTDEDKVRLYMMKLSTYQLKRILDIRDKYRNGGYN